MNTHANNKLIAELQSFISQIPFVREVQVSVAKADKGFVQLSINPRPSLFNHFNTYQAGVIFTLAEITGGALCGTFVDLANNLLVTKRAEIDFFSNTDNVLIAEAKLEEVEVKQKLLNLQLKKKVELSVTVLIKSLNEEVIAKSFNSYYLRLGIPKSFHRKNNL